MKVHFEDGSFLHIDESVNDGKVITITMCGISNDGNKLTMSSSDLDEAQVQEIHDFLDKKLKSFT
jgi:hypothetical protein